MSSNKNHELSEALSISEQRRRDMQRLSGVGFWELNHKAGTLYWSEEIFVIYGLKANAIEPNYDVFVSLIYDDDREMVNDAYLDSVERGSEYNIRYRIKSGCSTKWIEARGVTYYDNRGNPEKSIGIARDISEVIDAQKETEYLASHDVLTGLPNRNLLADRIIMALHQARRNDSKVAVLFIDLDNFKLINDQHGHDVGDEVLIAVAQQLQIHARDSDTFARIGGDEFIGILAVKSDSDLDHAIRRVKDSICKSYETRSGKFVISASIGVAIYPADGDEPDELMRHADHAMYEAKEAGKSQIRYFDTNKHQSNVSRHQLLRDIESAIINNEFVLYFQPRICLKTGAIIGAEALLRWFRADGPFPPSEVVAAINGTTLEWNLDAWVIKTVMADSKSLNQQISSGIISLNVNPSTIENPNFPNYLSAQVTEKAVSGESLEIEILEVSSINNLELTNEILHQCKALGLSLSLDDFGTGYSSLTYLHSLPIDKLKIDKYFIQNLLTDTNSLALVKSILAMASANECPVVAEGVESYAIARTLIYLGCDYAQGFGIARPMARADYVEWVKNWNPQVFLEQVNSPVA